MPEKPQIISETLWRSEALNPGFPQSAVTAALNELERELVRYAAIYGCHNSFTVTLEKKQVEKRD